MKSADLKQLMMELYGDIKQLDSFDKDSSVVLVCEDCLDVRFVEPAYSRGRCGSMSRMQYMTNPICRGRLWSLSRPSVEAVLTAGLLSGRAAALETIRSVVRADESGCIPDSLRWRILAGDLTR